MRFMSLRNLPLHFWHLCTQLEGWHMYSGEQWLHGKGPSTLFAITNMWHYASYGASCHQIYGSMLRDNYQMTSKLMPCYGLMVQWDLYFVGHEWGFWRMRLITFWAVHALWQDEGFRLVWLWTCVGYHDIRIQKCKDAMILKLLWIRLFFLHELWMFLLSVVSWQVIRIMNLLNIMNQKVLT